MEVLVAEMAVVGVKGGSECTGDYGSIRSSDGESVGGKTVTPISSFN